MQKSLNVFFTIDERFITHFGVTLTSLLENNRDIDLEIYVIHDLADIKKLDNVIHFFKSKYKKTLHLLALNNEVFNTFTINRHVSKATYFRLLIADIIPADVTSGLYLDADTIVTGSLSGLADIDFDAGKGEQFFLMAVPEQDSVNVDRLHDMGIKTESYFNAGVLLINLKAWRQAAVSEKLVAIAQKYASQLLWWDQDVLNINFAGKWGKLSTTYNGLNLTQKLPQKPLIIHYAGSTKPWLRNCRHPYQDEYFKYFKKRKYKYLPPVLIFIYSKILRTLNWGSAFAE